MPSTQTSDSVSEAVVSSGTTKASLDSIAKRFILLPAIVLAVPGWILLTPLALAAGVIADLISGLRRFPLARLWIFLGAVILIEWYALTTRVLILLGRTLRIYRRRPQVMGVWAGLLLGAAQRILGFNLRFPEPLEMPAGRLLLLSRHSSGVDAIVPAWLINGPLNRAAHYILKRELSWMPSINLFVPMLGNYFVRRGADTEAELKQISSLAGIALPDSVLVIFPEGTYATEKNRARVRASLERRGETQAVELADSLNHLLPPKPAGTIALLASRPEADVIVFAHVGLEPLGRFATLRKAVPLQHPVRFHWWHIPREDIPTDPDAQEQWLQQRWLQMDAWVTSENASRV